MSANTPSFEQIPLRMMQLGVERAWLANACRYSRSTLANALAKNGSNRNERALATIWEALDREEERLARESKTPVFESQQIVLRPTEEQYEAWSAAQIEDGQPTLAKWAMATLNTQAVKIAARTRLRAEPDHGGTRSASRFARRMAADIFAKSSQSAGKPETGRAKEPSKPLRL